MITGMSIAKIRILTGVAGVGVSLALAGAAGVLAMPRRRRRIASPVLGHWARTAAVPGM